MEDKFPHYCVDGIFTRQIDDCSGEANNYCKGENPMVLSLWYADKDGTECYFDNWIEKNVNYCPFCGLKAKGYGDVDGQA